jgi:hypothetical protein
MNSVVLSPGKLHQYPVLSCGKHLYDFHITNGGREVKLITCYTHTLYMIPTLLAWYRHLKVKGINLFCRPKPSPISDMKVIQMFSTWFYWNFSDGGIFLLSHYFLKKKPVQSCLNPSSSLITIYFVFFLQNGRGNNIQIWIKLHKDIYGSVKSFTTCCTTTV